MNDKGQTLVVFVLVLPLLMMIIAGVIEMGSLSLTKSNYEDSIISAIDYGLDNIDKENVEDKMIALLEQNIKGNKNVEILDGIIKVHVTSNLDGLFSKIFKNNYEINLTYKGYLEGNNKKIIKD